jgi:hypothetical protein
MSDGTGQAGQPNFPQITVNQPQDYSGMTQMGPEYRVTPKREFKYSGLPGMVQTIVQQVQARKQRETQQTVDSFVQNSRGLDESQGQFQEAQQVGRTAVAELQAATTPEARQAAIQKIQAASQRARQAQQAMEQNRTNLKDMFNGPKGDRHSKMMSKAFGIDDKNAQTPERQAAIQAIQKQKGIDAQSARFMSQMAQRQQLSPQSAGTAQAVKAGAVGRPASQGDQLRAAVQQRGQDMRAAEQQASQLAKAGVSEAYIRLRANKQGQVAERQPDGEYSIRPMTDEEKSIFGAAQQGKMAWTMKDGHPVAVLRNPQTNQIVPGSENPYILPPSYMMEHIHEGDYFWTDGEGNVHETPVTTVTKPVLGGQGGPTGAPPTARPTQHVKVTPTSPMPQKGVSGDKILGQKVTAEQLQMRMNYEKQYEKPARDAETSYKIQQAAWGEYQDAAKRGQHLPTGAQSMVLMSRHIQSTFGVVKGGRVTRDLIQEHFHARSISDEAVAAFQKLYNGDHLSPPQWQAFHELISESRKETWESAYAEAIRHKVPIDFMPLDLIKQGVGAPEGFQRGRDSALTGSDHKTIIGWRIGGKIVNPDGSDAPQPGRN